jgi:hypothetical protein
MEIYNRFGALYPDNAERVYKLSVEMFEFFLQEFGEESLPDQRVFMHETLSYLPMLLSVHILRSAMNLKNKERSENLK